MVLLFSASLHADITNIFTDRATATKQESESAAGTVLGQGPGKISAPSAATVNEKAESPTVFGKNHSKESESSSGRSRASSVFGTHKSSAPEKQTTNDTAEKEEKDGHSKERISDSENPRAAPNYLWPVDGGKIVSFYGWRSSRRFHDGIDIKADSGTNVFAAKSGEVIYSDHKIRGYGNMVVIRHNAGFSTVYAHNKVNLVHKGDVVQQGYVIAHVGSTGHASGPHSHFEVRKGKYSADPLKYLSQYDIKKHSGAYENSPENPF